MCVPKLPLLGTLYGSLPDLIGRSTLPLDEAKKLPQCKDIRRLVRTGKEDSSIPEVVTFQSGSDVNEVEPQNSQTGKRDVPKPTNKTKEKQKDTASSSNCVSCGKRRLSNRVFSSSSSGDPTTPLHCPARHLRLFVLNRRLLRSGSTCAKEDVYSPFPFLKSRSSPHNHHGVSEGGESLVVSMSTESPAGSSP